MTVRQMRLLKLAEECNEVAQRASKQILFGDDEVQRGQEYSNAWRLREEILDMLVCVALLERTGTITRITGGDVVKNFRDKRAKIMKMTALAIEQGELEPSAIALPEYL